MIEAIASRCTESESGARNIENVLTHGILPEVSTRFLERLANGQPIGDVRVSLDNNGAFSYSVE